MPPIVTNDVITMPEPSNHKSSPSDSVSASSGHRSPQRASAAEHPPVSEKLAPDAPATLPSTEVFAVYGVEPEIQAYAMAKYSRSALSMKESLREMNSQKAESFSTLSTFSTAIARLPIWLISHWRSKDFRSLRRSNSPMSNAGTGRSVRHAIRISRRAVITSRISEPTTKLASSTARRWISFLPSMTRSRLT